MLSPPSVAPNPHVAFAWLLIDGVPVTVDDMTGRPRHLESFSFEQEIEMTGRFQFTLFDPKYDYVEDLIARAKGKCEFWYGYTTGAQSAHFSGWITGYTPEFVYDGIRLSLEGVVIPFKEMPTVSRTRAWRDKRISDIVKEIAKENGLTPVVDVTRKVESPEDLDTTDFKDLTWKQHGNDLKFLVEKLTRQAVRESDGAGGFIVYVDHEKNELHFHPPKYELPPEGEPLIWRHRMTEIISFRPNYDAQGLATALLGGSVQAPAVDATDGVRTPNMYSENTGEGTSYTTDGKNDKTHPPLSDTPWAPTNRLAKDFPDGPMAANEAKYWWYRAAYISSFDGTLVIVGNPGLKPHVKREIQVHKATGGLHWTSGIYWIRSVKHVIQDGAYTTECGVWRSDAKAGEMTSKRKKGG